MFCVVSGKHYPFASSEYSGVVSAQVDDETKDVSSFLWPIPFEFVVPGLRFTANLQHQSHPQFGLQYRARHVQMTDGNFTLRIDAMKKKLTPVLFKRLAALTRRFQATVFEKLHGVMDGSVPVECLVGGHPKTTIEQASRVVEAYQETLHAVDVSVQFPPIDANMAVKYGDKLNIEDIRADPYVLYWRKPNERFEGDPLHVADVIAKMHLDVPCDAHDERRLAAYFEEAVQRLQTHQSNLSERGSTWFTRESISSQMVELQADRHDAWSFDEASLVPMFTAPPSFVARDGEMYARQYDREIEESLAQKLSEIRLDRARVTHSALNCICEFEKLIASVDVDETKASLNATYGDNWCDVFDAYVESDETQRSTVRVLCEQGVLVLMGGAGTGKSTTLGLIVRFAQRIIGVEMKACALTGKAVDRLKTLFSRQGDDGIDCRTLHSMSAKVQSDPITALAIDEASMAFPSIVEKILAASHLSFLVICGDDKQLPSIQSGAFLRDIVSSDLFATVRLQRIYRTGEGSGIATEAPKIFARGNAQLEVAPLNVNGFKIVLDPDLDLAITECARFARIYGNQHVAMVSNTRKTCKDANRELQSLFNVKAADKLEARLSRGDGYAPWVLNDRVISNENIDLEGGARIFNGMEGEVVGVDTGNKIVTVRFRNIVHDFKSRTSAIDHAYCVTTWKYQGSEVQACVVFFGHHWGLSCELVYTAVTRGQQATTMYISRSHFRHALDSRVGSSRETRLRKRLEDVHRVYTKKRLLDIDDETP